MSRALYKLAIVFLLLLLSVPVYASGELFTEEEQAYINAKKVITVGVVDSNEPYTYFRNGNIKGYSIDFMNMIQEVSGLKIHYKMGNWTNIYHAFLNGELDAINEISYTPEREKFIIFSDPYHIRRTVVFVRSDSGIRTADNITSLKGRKVGYIKDIFYAGTLRGHNLSLTEFNNNVDMIKSLAFGWIDAVFVSELGGRFIARENTFSNIISVGNLKVDGLKEEDLRIGVLKNNPLLAGVINKSISALPEPRKEELEKLWSIYNGQVFSAAESIELTPAEEAFIRSRPSVSVGMLPDFYPFSFASNDEIMGYTDSLLKIISRRTGLDFTYNIKPWSAILSDFRNETTDMIADISLTAERKPYTLFTDEYARIPSYVFVRDDFGKYTGVQSLRGKTVGITKDIFFKDLIDKNKLRNLQEYSSRDEMLKDLSFGRLDAVITSLNSGSSMIKKYALLNVTIGGEFNPDGKTVEDLRFGISPALPELHSIVTKALLSVSQEERILLENQWLVPQLNEMRKPTLSFTDEEKEYLKNKKIIRMCVDPDWMPFEKIEDGKVHSGMAADFIKLMQKNSGIQIHLAPTDTWAESLKMAENRECDILSLAMRTPERLKYFSFTTPYIIIPTVIATSINDPFIDNIEDVLDKSFATVKGYSINEILRNKYPKIKLVELDSDTESIALLQKGEVYGAIGTMAGIGYQIKQQKIVDIKISGRLNQDWELGIAARNDEPLLVRIFQKLVDSISEEDKNAITGKWMSIRYDQGFDYRLFWKIMGVFAFLAAVIAYWSHKLKKLNKELHAANIRLQELSDKDSLTGLYNRRFFAVSSQQAFNICQRSGIRFSVAIIDIDHFKKVNDTFGHLFGDKGLQEMANTLIRHFQRQTDACSRFGGEEFAVFITNTGEDTLTTRIENIRREMEKKVIEMENMRTTLTISAGVYSAVPSQEDTLDDALKRADDALYKAKNEGRNRTVVWREDA
ncbi:transporter substrate-binding domain-containing diguanylate cyclase [Geovibrio thiophilus]|nr:transporter substrate-binding domain-containing protein [Geovibrio thiophilus]